MAAGGPDKAGFWRALGVSYPHGIEFQAFQKPDLIKMNHHQSLRQGPFAPAKTGHYEKLCKIGIDVAKTALAEAIIDG
ncbi:hypothetical protein TH25_11000 [Thalassospira profundimaris]|uniref:Uncharacterized protein n=2 Tax=Thalassospira profundimaris TaxID=502049 RepID=A0A367XAV8_9PROT|nr:hypothetical protein TH25_11000 [Thalassospira profundimaris]